MKLFEDLVRTRTTQSGHRESKFQFLNESSWEWVEYYREVVEEWYSEFPDDLDFHNQFTSRNDWQHASAFFELYIYTLFRKLGYRVYYHQSIGSRKMDLTIEKESSHKIMADCVLSGEPNLDLSIEKIEREIEDIIEAVHSPTYWISVDFLRTSMTTPKLSAIRRTIEEELSSLSLEIGEEKTITWWDDIWTIELSFFKKNPPTERSLGFVASSQRGGAVDGPSMKILRRTLNSKRGSNYGVDCPYIIAVNSSNITLYSDLVKGVLFGDIKVPGFNNNLFVKNPFFYMDKPQNTSVSGILIVKGLYSSNMGVVEIELWDNPWCRHPIPDDLLDLTRYIPKVDESGRMEKIESRPGKKPFEILDIKENYINYDH